MKAYCKNYSQWKDELLAYGETSFPGITKKEKAAFVAAFEKETGKRLQYTYITHGIKLYHGVKIKNFTA